MSTTNLVSRFTHHLIRRNPLLQSSLQWRRSTNNTLPSSNLKPTRLLSSLPWRHTHTLPSFNLKFIPFLSSHSIKPFNPNSDPDIQSEYADRIRVGDIIDTIMHAARELRMSANDDPDPIWSANPKLKADTQYEDSDRVDDIVDTILMENPAIGIVLMMPDPFSYLAASGGRMGGSSTSSSRSSSSSKRSSSRSFSPPLRISSSSMRRSSSSGSSGSNDDDSQSLSDIAGIIAPIFILGIIILAAGSGTKKTTVIKLQVGFLGTARSLQKELNLIAETANTSTPEGLSYVLTGSTVALLRHPVDDEETVKEAEKLLNKYSIEERAKFDEETLVNVNNMRRKRRTSLESDGFGNEYIVITILVAAEGDHKLPTINGIKDLKDALQKLGSIPSSQIAAVEVLWTPQDEDDELSENELLEDYPHLKTIH